MTVHRKLLAGFGAVVVTLLVPALIASARLADLQRLAVEGRARHAEALVSLGRLQASLAELDRFERSYVAAGEEALAASADRELAAMREEYGALARSPYQDEAAAIPPLVDEIDRRARGVDRLMRSGRVAEATEAFAALDHGFRALEAALAEATDAVNASARRDLAGAAALSASSRRETWIGMIVALAIALAIAAWASTTLTRPLRRLGRAMARVADGDFDSVAGLPSDRRDEIGDLTRSFEVMSSRLADLDRMKAEFIGVASHELKTPVNAIHGYAELIREEYGDRAPAEYTQMVEGIGEQARVVARLVDRLMDLSRLETGSYRMQREAVHLRDLLTGLLRGFEVAARRGSVTLGARLEDGAPETAFLDLDLIRDEVLGNLVANALRHTPAGGRVDVAVSGTPDHVVFTVSDTGPGIPAGDRPLVFRKYFRGATDAPGTGLGLAIARETVLLHGGSIELDDTPVGAGACFRVTLPRTPLEEDAVSSGDDAGLTVGARPHVR